MAEHFPTDGYDSQDQHLEAFFKACLTEARLEPQQLDIHVPAMRREWWPGFAPANTAPAEIIRRHPEFSYGLNGIARTKVRQVVRGASRGRYGKFSSRKMGRSIRARSDLEFDCIRWMEFDPEISAYLEQPVILRYQMDGKWRLHTPDLFIRRAGGDGFIEVKPEEIAVKPEIERKYEAIGKAVSALGYSYSVLTDQFIRRRPAFDTLKKLFLRYRWVELPDPPACDLIAVRLRAETISVGQLMEKIPVVTPNQVMALILRGFLTIDLDSPLGCESLVRLSGHPPVRKGGRDR